ncbi:hypothetical protein AB0C84_40325 [Actinomadura sp. NPDC048955]|uniref:hypothetical protein n=1 Tax=Actinomadura sp. NPDC048955 TaxID=3158228 RepID=UPI0033EBEB6D
MKARSAAAAAVLMVALTLVGACGADEPGKAPPSGSPSPSPRTTSPGTTAPRASSPRPRLPDWDRDQAEIPPEDD